MNKVSHILLFMLCLTSCVQVQAQADMADVMRSNGKIYVVVAVCMIILTGLFLYVWRIDRKIKKMERGN